MDNQFNIYCDYCDPVFFIIYGFCGNCQRRCEPPLYDPNSSANILDHEELRNNWSKERGDLVNDSN